MSHEYKRVRIKKFAQLEERETPEVRYWKKFKQSVVIKNTSSVTNIDFSPIAPHDFVVTAGPRINIYDGKSTKEKKSISKFKDIAYSGNFRSDGKLIVSGGVKPIVQVFDAKTKTVLRSYTGHSAPIHTTRFASNNIHIISASDDQSVRLWDMPSQTPLHTIENAHNDYIRCSALGGANLFATGSYDHTVKLWDSRILRGSSEKEDSKSNDIINGEDEDDDNEDGAADKDVEMEESDVEDDADKTGDLVDDDDSLEEDDDDNFSSDMGSTKGKSSAVGRNGCVLSVNHGEPVTQVLMMPEGSAMITAGGRSLKLWDTLSGRLIHTFSNHQKLITSLTLDGTQTRLLSGGLDGAVKVYDVGNFNVSYQMRFPAPVLALGLSADNGKLAVGLADGGLHMKQRVVRMEEVLRENLHMDLLRSGTYRFFLRGGERSTETFALADVSSDRDKKPKLKSYDKMLKAFNYSGALEAALATKSAVIVSSVLSEISNQNAMSAAVSGQNALVLEPLVSHIVQYVAHPRYSSILIDVANAVLDVHAPQIGKNHKLDMLLVKLSDKLSEELKAQKELLNLQGTLDLLMAASTRSTN